MKTIRILIADTSSTVSQHLNSYLSERGFQVFVANDGEEALRIILTSKPQISLIDLMVPKLNALSILKNIKSTMTDETEPPTKVVILSNQTHVSNIKECFKWGAADFLLKPLDLEDIVSRIVFHLQPSRTEPRATEKRDSSNLYLHLIELALNQIHQTLNVKEEQLFSETLHKLTQLTAMTLKSVRVSIIKCEPNRSGLVKASSDDINGNEWSLDLRKYPEILYVMNTGKTVVIENLANNANLNQIKQYFSNISFNSLIVVPIYRAPEQIYGVFTIRMPEDRVHILDEELRFAKILAQALGLALNNYLQLTELA